MGEANRPARRHQGWEVGARVVELGSRGDCLADRFARNGCPCETFEFGDVLSDAMRWKKWQRRFSMQLRRRQVLAFVVSPKAAGHPVAECGQVRLRQLYALARAVAAASVPVLWESLAGDDFSGEWPSVFLPRQYVANADWCRFGGRFRTRARYHLANIDYQDLRKISSTCDNRHGLCSGTGTLHHTVGRFSAWRGVALRRPPALSARLASIILDAARAFIYN